MKFEPWMFAAMEEEGIMDTQDGHIHRVAKYIKNNGYTHVGNAEFIQICKACNVDPYSFDSSDIEKIERLAKG